MVLCLFIYFLAVHFDWSNILIRKSFGASRHISGKLGVKLAIQLQSPFMFVFFHRRFRIQTFFVSPYPAVTANSSGP